MRKMIIVLSVWYSVSVFTKTDFTWAQYDNVIALIFPDTSFSHILTDLIY